MPGSCSFRSDSGATKSGITNWSSESASRGRGRGARWCGGSGEGGRREAATRRKSTPSTARELAAAQRPVVGTTSSPTAVRDRLVLGHGSSAIALGEELPHRAPGGEQRQRDERAREAVDLPAGEQPEDDEQRVQPQRVAHHVRDDDVPLDLVDAEEEQRDPDRRERITTSA